MDSSFEKMLVELDKSGAEWVVVAYVSGDERMIEVCENGEDPHLITGSLISGADTEFVELEGNIVKLHTDPDLIEKLRSDLETWPTVFLPRTMSIRQCGKKSNHGLNYDEGYSTFALINEMSESEAKRIKAKYFQVYPGIKEWHGRIREQLSENRTLYACELPKPSPLHRKQRFLEAWGHDLFRRAYSFIPQSTVGDITNRGMILFYQDEELKDVELLANGHDSLLFQMEIKDWSKAATNIRRIANHLDPILTYEDRQFRIATELKIGKNWGSMQEIDLKETTHELGERLEDGWHRLD